MWQALREVPERAASGPRLKAPRSKPPSLVYIYIYIYIYILKPRTRALRARELRFVANLSQGVFAPRHVVGCYVF